MQKDTSKPKSLVTGGAGFIGSNLVDKLLELGHEVIVIDNEYSEAHEHFYWNQNAQNHKLDIRDYENTRRLYEGVDYVFHIAAEARIQPAIKNPIEAVSINSVGTATVLQCSREANVKRVIYSSTSSAYGRNPIPNIENQPDDCLNPYAVSKAFQDLLSQVYVKSFGLNIIITRMFSYTNARRYNLFQTAFANQIVKIERGELNCLKHGNLNSIRTFVDIEDAMEAYWLAATKGKIGEIYNIGGNKIISVKNFLQELIKLSKCKIKCSIDKSLLRPQDVTLQIPDVSKFKKHTGWKAKINFKASVKKLLNECRQSIK